MGMFLLENIMVGSFRSLCTKRVVRPPESLFFFQSLYVMDS